MLFFGLPSGVSAAILNGLLDDGLEIAGVVVPSASVPHLLPGTSPPYVHVPPVAAGLRLVDDVSLADTLGIAWSAGLPVMAVSDFNHPESLAVLRGYAADIACVACFTQRFPPAVLRLPRLGILNIHPSLLPAYRGPLPVFWQLRDGAPTGATVHYMDEGLDTGDIAAQSDVFLPDGLPGPEVERTLMLAGLDLLRKVLAELARGSVRRRPQPPGGSYYSFPTEEDFFLSTDGPAWRAFNFMRGTAVYGMAYRVDVAGETLRLAAAESFTIDHELDQPLVQQGRDVLIRFNPGALRASLVQ